MRVLVYGFAGHLLGGIETFILNMNEHMSDGCIFDYMIDGDKCIHRERIARKGGEIYCVTPIRKNPFAYARDVWKTLGLCKKKGTKIAYFQMFSMCNVLPILLAKMRGYTVVLHAHNNGLQSQGTAYGALHTLGKCLMGLGNDVRLTNSDLSAQFMFGKHKRAELIYNAIAVDEYRFDPAVRDEVRREFGAREKMVVGFVGRLEKQKNPLFLLRVFSAIRKRRPEAELWIVGEGSLKGDMDHEIETLGMGKAVVWFGRRGDVGRLMQGMDLLLLPSLFEGLGIVLVEGQAAGLACLTSEGTVPKVVGVTGDVEFAPLTAAPDTWAERACALSPVSDEHRARSARMVEESSFNIQREARRLEEILTKLNAQRGYT